MEWRGKEMEEMEREGLKHASRKNSWLRLCLYTRSTWSHRHTKSPAFSRWHQHFNLVIHAKSIIITRRRWAFLILIMSWLLFKLHENCFVDSDKMVNIVATKRHILKPKSPNWQKEFWIGPLSDRSQIKREQTFLEKGFTFVVQIVQKWREG